MSKNRLGRHVGLKSLGLAMCVGTLCFFASCGDDSSSGSDPKYEMHLCDSTSVGTVDSLDGVHYICEADGWVQVPDSISAEITTDDSLGENSSVSEQDTTKKLDSLTGDSLVTDSAKNGDTSDVTKADTSKKEEKNPSKLENATVTGVFGYGIFDSRSTVVVEVLDESFKKAESSFPATISAKEGSYTAANVTFLPPYARANLYGNVTDLVHGGSITMKDTLFALVTAQGKGGKANVNVLTYLQSVYMQRLLKSSESMTVEKASKKASDAVWKMFHFDKAGLGAVDSVTSFAGGETGAALLAVTIMMQAVANDTAANLWKVAADFADGSWKDFSARAKIADWAFDEDVNDEFETIHKNVEKLGLAAVPDFEKYIRTFYLAELGMDACSDENAGKIFFSKNKSSVYYASDLSDVSVTATRFICDEKTKAWREAMDKEKDTYGFGAGQDGETRQGLVNAGIVYTYNETSGNWRVVSSRAERDAYFVKKSAITDFVDIQKVYEGIKDDEKVIFLLRHGARIKDATNKDDPLSAQGIADSKNVGAKLKKHKEDFRLGASEFYRAQQTVISIALGRGQDTLVADTIRELNDDWYMVNRDTVNKVEAAVGGWEAIGLYVYNGEYTDDAETVAYYNLKDRSAELIEDVLLAKYDTVPERFIMLSSHDKLMVPFVAYCSDLNINMNLKGGGKWINYLAGIAIIWDKSGNRRYVAFKGLKDAYFDNNW